MKKEEIVRAQRKREHGRGKTLEQEIRKGYLIGFFVVILISVIVFAVFSIKVYWTQAVKFCENVVELNLNLLDNQLLTIQDAQKTFSNDPRIKEIVKYRLEGDEIDYAIELYNQREILDRFQLMNRNAEVENIYIVDRNGTCLYSSQMAVDGESLRQQEWFQHLTQRIELNISYMSEIHDQSYYYDHSDKKCISMVMPMAFGTDSVSFVPRAFLVCDINLNRILGKEGKDIRFAVTDVNGEWYSAQEQEEDREIREWLHETGGQERMYVKNTDELLAVSMKAYYFDLRLVGMRKMSEMGSIKVQIFLITLFVLAAAAVLIAVLSHKTSAYITEPLKRLVKKCNIVAKGNYDVTFPRGDREEIEVLSGTIQGMIENIVSLNQKMIEEEKALSKEKLKALQHQINPHFMNNVLQSIKALAIAGETEKISEISTALGKVMAYSVYRPYDVVTLEEELEHVRNYLHVQNIRYDNRILYTVECSEELKETPILKLTLQPIIENAIEHGLGVSGKEMVALSVEAEGDDVYIIIYDSGKGISKEKMEELRENLYAGRHYERGKSVGILNVNARLKKQYGNPYGIELNSKEGTGTTVIVKLPRTERCNE